MGGKKTENNGRERKCIVKNDEYPEFKHQITSWHNNKSFNQIRTNKNTGQINIAKWLKHEMLYLLERDVCCVLKTSECGRLALFGLIPDIPVSEERKSYKALIPYYHNEAGERGDWRDGVFYPLEEDGQIQTRRNANVINNLKIFNVM